MFNALPYAGWCAVNPDIAKQRFGMPFQQLECGDLCQMPLRFAPVSSPDICDRFKRWGSQLHFLQRSVGYRYVDVESATFSGLANNFFNCIVDRFSFPPEDRGPNHSPLLSPILPFLLSPPNTPTQKYQPSPAAQASLPTHPQAQVHQLAPQPFAKEAKQSRSQNSLDPDRPKRPMNAFMLFAKQHRLKLIQMHPGKDNR